MIEGDILDDYRDNDDRDWVQESFEYRILLTFLWLVWGAWLFYDGSIILDLILNSSRGLLTLFMYRVFSVYASYLLGALTFGMAIIIFRQSKDRISYLCSFLGVILLISHCITIDRGGIIAFLPMLALFFVKNLRACLVSYGLSVILFILVSNNILNTIGYFFTYERFLIAYSLIFMSIVPYRKKLFPLKGVIIKLRYRLYLLIGFLPFILERLFN